MYPTMFYWLQDLKNRTKNQTDVPIQRYYRLSVRVKAADQPEMEMCFLPVIFSNVEFSPHCFCKSYKTAMQLATHSPSPFFTLHRSQKMYIYKLICWGSET